MSHSLDRRRIATAMAIVWTVLNALAAASVAASSFSLITAVGALLALFVSAGNLFAIRVFFQNDRREWYSAARKWFGYATVGAYAALAIPLADRREAGVLADNLGAVIFALIVLSTLAGTVLWLFLHAKSSRVYWKNITEAEASEPKLIKERLKKVKKDALGITLEWVDTAAWAIIFVIVIQRLLFQLYAIPSESMVPTLLIGDRPVIAKFLDGPTFPFAPAAFPRVSEPKRGDIAVFENPAIAPSPPAFRFLQEIVFYLTFSNVDLDKGPDGQPKVSRLIKRVIGVPGDQLMMVDDAVYYRRDTHGEWKPLPGDAGGYAHVDLSRLPASITSKIRNIPVQSAELEFLRAWDKRKNAWVEEELAASLAAVRGRLEAAFAAYAVKEKTAAALETLGIQRLQANAAWEDALAIIGDASVRPWRFAAELRYDPVLLGQFLLNPDERNAWLAFLVPPPRLVSADPYAIAGRMISLFAKLRQAERIELLLSLAQPTDSAAGQTALSTSERYRIRTQEDAEFLSWLSIYDFRNFPRFPNEGGLPAGGYFFMGDNRYNSVDCRFDAGQKRRPLAFDDADAASVVRDSMLAPRMIDKKYILGRSVLRLFPFNRIGPIR